MTKAELQLEVEMLSMRVKELTQKARLLNEVVLHYADPLKEYDHGKMALKVIKMISKGYKPVIGDLAVMFKEKEMYPFIEFAHYLDDREGDLDEEA